MRTSRTAVGLVAAAGLLVAGGLAAGTLAASGALASTTPTPKPSASGTPGAPGDADGDGRTGRHGDGHGRRGGGLGFGLRDGVGGGRMLHGEMVVEKSGGGTETLLVQHGSVTAKTSDSVTVKSTDGFTVTWTVSSDTKIMTGPRRPGTATSALADVATGADVVVTGPKTADGGTARMVGVRPAGAKDGARHGSERGTAPSSSSSSSAPSS
jgi:hypothetical protein